MPRERRILPLCRSLAGATLLLAAGTLATGAQTLPDPDEPATRPGLFDRLFDRREHLRRSAPLRRSIEQAERAAERARERADEARRDGALPPLPGRGPARQSGELATEPDEAERRAAAERLHQRLMQDRLQRFLGAAGRADSAAVEAQIAGARAARTGTVARGMERLQAGAAAERSTLGERRAPGPRPLIRMPRVERD